MTTWSWLVSHGTGRPSILTEASAPDAVNKWVENHPNFEVYKRAPGHQWDGQKLSASETRRYERRIALQDAND